MVLVKADLHIHTSDDFMDGYIDYSARDLIDRAAAEGFGVLSITLHDRVFPAARLKRYAASKGILLIQGVEATIEHRHVLLYNITGRELAKIKIFEDLRKQKRRNKRMFVIAAHPFYFNGKHRISLRKKYGRNRDVFDALELSFMYSRLYNPNRKMQRAALRDRKPVVANSDLHFMSLFGRNYSVVDVKGKLNEKNFFDAVRKNRVKLVTKPLGFREFLSALKKYLIMRDKYSQG